MTTRQLGAIIVGTGFGILTHARALRAAGFDIKAVVGRDPEKTRQRAAKFNIPMGLTDLSEALALPGVDAVAVATPPHTHAAIVLAATAAGKHIVCEKPFAANAEEAQQMYDAASAAGVVHFVGAEFRWQTSQALATKAVHDGLIGTPRMAQFILLVPALVERSAEVPDWWGDRNQGGGWLGAYGSHVIDHIRHMLGDFTGVSATLELLSDHDWTADDAYSAHFRTSTGVSGVMQSSISAVGSFQSSLRVIGSSGSLWVENDQVIISDATGQRTLEAGAYANDHPVPPSADLLVTAYDMLHSMGTDLAPYTKLYETFRNQILGDSAPSDIAPATFADGVQMQKVLDAIRTASAEKCWVDIN
ncbi:Myo-inositol 2-dehydrogenase [Halioglobus japonicus]|nr:Myo-inositol 2-dehydrogenase [Halioglobus japonicus]